jgi:hypothetical protein
MEQRNVAIPADLYARIERLATPWRRHGSIKDVCAQALKYYLESPEVKLRAMEKRLSELEREARTHGWTPPQ